MKALKKILGIWCAIAMLVIMPGVCVLADELQENDFIVSIAEDPEQTPNDTVKIEEEAPDEEVASEITDEDKSRKCRLIRRFLG